MAFEALQRLEVHRRLSTSELVSVGVLAQNKQGVFFQYDADYLARFGNLSPFAMQVNSRVQAAPKQPHKGLHGVFADALPDGWGLLLQDRILRQNNILPSRVTAMDRLAFVGNTALGALSFSPVSAYATANNSEDDTDLFALGLNAQQIFDGQTEQVLSALVAAGSSGGARPKAQVYANGDNLQQCRTIERPGDSAWIVKFTSQNLALGHEEGLCEAAYLTLASKANLNPPHWQLVNTPKQSGATQWLAVKRFDYQPAAHDLSGRYHMHSACGLLDADFRSPSLDYDDLIRVTKTLCKSPAAGQLQFKRAMFNLLMCNHDDHSKNWSFLQDDTGNWQPAPFFDVTFSPHPYGEHATAYNGFGKQPPLKAIQKLADTAGFTRWEQAKQVIEELLDVVNQFANVANQLNIKPDTIKLISQQLAATRKANSALSQFS